MEIYISHSILTCTLPVDQITLFTVSVVANHEKAEVFPKSMSSNSYPVIIDLVYHFDVRNQSQSKKKGTSAERTFWSAFSSNQLPSIEGGFHHCLNATLTHLMTASVEFGGIRICHILSANEAVEKTGSRCSSHDFVVTSSTQLHQVVD